ncbi:general stress protein [Paenibacillus sp. sptzw28]|uniref:general stress protein n=1 Tax=Paenibacillus sp. sptzw28 TaxID=715179 RepID=UPI001C6F2220|nr:general stress protein [Paenibacillus sp. sptzw28]QYR20862.1 general stress protein [Paenibacillus sp. sptzw28]
MTMKIGIFKMEEQAVEAVKALEQSGFSRNEIKVLAKDGDHSRRIEAETDVDADEVRELADTRDQMDDGYGFGNLGPVGLAGTVGMVGPLTGGAWPYGAGILAVGGLLVDENGMEDAIHALGIKGDDAGVCREAIVDGALVVTADTGDGSQHNIGQDLSREAEEAFRRCGAERIL